jgi:hypothetical protein
MLPQPLEDGAQVLEMRLLVRAGNENIIQIDEHKRKAGSTVSISL